MNFRQLTTLTIALILNLSSFASNAFAPSDEFGSMWWLNTINNQKQFDFAIQTTNYGLLFDYNKLEISSLWINDKALSSQDFYATPSNKLLKTGNKGQLEFGVIDHQKTRSVAQSSEQIKNCQLVTAGRYTQKRFINELKGIKGADAVMSGLEIYSHTDCFNLIYRFKPSENCDISSLFLSYEFDSNYTVNLDNKNGYIIVKHKASKAGFIILPTSKTSEIAVKKGKIICQTKESKFDKSKDYEVGILVFTFTDLEENIKQFTEGRHSEIKIMAKALHPSNQTLNWEYNFNEDIYNIKTHIDAPKDYSRSMNNEKVAIKLENSSQHSKKVKLNFSKHKFSSSITGISGIITDPEGNPTGLPVQISKNWHRDNKKPQRYEGSWSNMYTVIELPANSTTELIYNCVTGYWGTLPAVSHAQLSLVGWGSSVQLWEQSALGSWGESICYSPDGNVGNANITDVRPAFIKNSEGECFKWGGNIGGGDFINITDSKAERMHHQNIRIEKVRYAPNLTEMTYYGDLADGAASFQYTIMLSRTNDMVKGRYNIKIKVHKDFSFTNFAVFSAAAYRYAFAQSLRTARGNNKGLIKEWELDQTAPANAYIGEKFTIKGDNPWIAQTHTILTNPGNKLSANRGLVLREWDAKIAGKQDVEAHWGEFMVLRSKSPRSIINLTLPDNCNELKAGDYINASVDMLIFHQKAEDYCADNTNFKEALEQHPNSWQLVYREARENDYTVNVSKGKLIDNRPIKIEASNNMAEGKIVGGLAYEPITFTNLSTYVNPVLYIKEKGEWVRVDQSKDGKDFWQCDYNGDSKSWEISYNIALDDHKFTEFRFEVG